MENPFKKGDIVMCKDSCGGLTNGKNYTVLDVRAANTIIIEDDQGDQCPYMFYRFVIITPVEDSLEGQIKKAQTLLGQKIVTKHGAYCGFIPNEVVIAYKGSKGVSVSVIEYLQTHDYCVVLKNGRMSRPVAECFIPQNEIVKLNDKYEAEVSKGSIKVGCQSFTKEAIEELYKAVQEYY